MWGNEDRRGLAQRGRRCVGRSRLRRSLRRSTLISTAVQISRKKTKNETGRPSRDNPRRSSLPMDSTPVRTESGFRASVLHRGEPKGLGQLESRRSNASTVIHKPAISSTNLKPFLYQGISSGALRESPRKNFLFSITSK